MICALSDNCRSKVLLADRWVSVSVSVQVSVGLDAKG